MDFSCAGLAVHRMEAKMRCAWGDIKEGNGISFTVQGDNKVFCSPELGGKVFDINCTLILSSLAFQLCKM